MFYLRTFTNILSTFIKLFSYRKFVMFLISCARYNGAKHVCQLDVIQSGLLLMPVTEYSHPRVLPPPPCVPVPPCGPPAARTEVRRPSTEDCHVLVPGPPPRSPGLPVSHHPQNLPRVVLKDRPPLAPPLHPAGTRPPECEVTQAERMIAYRKVPR